MKRLFQIITAPFRWLWRMVSAPFRWLWGRWRAFRNFFTEAPADEPIGDILTRPFQGGAARAALLEGLIENIAALRQHLLRAVIALALTTLFSFAFAEQLMGVLAAPLTDNAQQQFFDLLVQATRAPLAAGQQLLALGAQGLTHMQVIEPTESIGVFMRVSLLAGLVLSMPWLVMEVYLFIAPGLMPRTRLRLLWGIPLASALFLLGVLFTYWIMLPTAVPFLFTFGGFKAAWRPSKYFELVTGLMFWIGLTFQMPLIIYALAGLGWVKASQLVEQWRLAIIVIAIIAAMVTPTVDPVSMGVVMVPMVLLYGLSILGARLAEGGRARRQKAAA